MTEKWTWPQWFGETDPQLSSLLLLSDNTNLWRLASKSLYYRWDSEDEKKNCVSLGAETLFAYIQEVLNSANLNTNTIVLFLCFVDRAS